MRLGVRWPALPPLATAKRPYITILWFFLISLAGAASTIKETDLSAALYHIFFCTTKLQMKHESYNQEYFLLAH